MTYRIVLQSPAANAIRAISDRRVQKKLKESIDKLRFEPQKQGKALRGELSGYRSIRAISQRYRIVYRVHEETVVVYVLTLGLRREGDKNDIYRTAQKILDSEIPGGSE